jgi:hypothetical protein
MDSLRVRLVDFNTKLVITLGVEAPNPATRDFVFDPERNSVIDAEGEVPFLPDAKTITQFKKNYLRRLAMVIQDNLPEEFPYAYGIGSVTMYSQKSNGGEMQPTVTSQYLWTPRDSRTIGQTRNGFTRSVNKFLYVWLMNAVKQVDKLTSEASGQTQLGVVNAEITLTRNDGVSPAGVWTGATIAKRDFNNRMHGVVDVKPSKKYPDACFLNALLAPSYEGDVSRLSSHYKVTPFGILKLNPRFFSDDNPLHNADVSMLIGGLVGEVEIDDFEEKNPNIKVSIWLYDRMTVRPIQQRGVNPVSTDTKIEVLLTVPLNLDRSEQTDTSHYVGLRHGIRPILSLKDNTAYPCDKCGHIYTTESSRLRCTCESPNAAQKFPGGCLKLSSAATADPGGVCIVADLEAGVDPESDTNKQTPYSVGMFAYKSPLIPGGVPRRIDLVDTSQPSTEVHTFLSTEKDAVISHFLKTMGHFGNDYRRRLMQNTRDLATSMSSAERKRFEADVVALAGVCEGCGKACDKFVPDHGHDEMTGDPVYREPLCSPCNLKKRVSGKITILMFNGSG